MARSSKDVQADLDAINRKRRALDRIIEDNRARLAAENAKVPDLEREYQAAVALEQQAAIDAKAQPKPVTDGLGTESNPWTPALDARTKH